jgi:hypothetical protein
LRGSSDEQSIAIKAAWLILAAVTFVLVFYAGTVVMSIMYPLDEAMLGF